MYSLCFPFLLAIYDSLENDRGYIINENLVIYSKIRVTEDLLEAYNRL